MLLFGWELEFQGHGHKVDDVIPSLRVVVIVVVVVGAEVMLAMECRRRCGCCGCCTGALVLGAA